MLPLVFLQSSKDVSNILEESTPRVTKKKRNAVVKKRKLFPDECTELLHDPGKNLKTCTDLMNDKVVALNISVNLLFLAAK